MPTHQVIHIHPAAPRKPSVGAPCNGCGVCCLAEPCPVGVLVSRRFKGACKALVWSDQAGRYHCGLMLPTGPDARAGRLRLAARRAWLWWVRRMISSGSGCDASIEVAQEEMREDVPGEERERRREVTRQDAPR